MASTYDLIMYSNTDLMATIYDTDGLTVVQQAPCVLTDWSALKTRREANDFVAGEFPPGTTIKPGQVVYQPGGYNAYTTIQGGNVGTAYWFLVAAIADITPGLLTPMPTRAQLLALPYLVSGERINRADKPTIRMLDPYGGVVRDTAGGYSTLDKTTYQVHALFSNELEALQGHVEGELPSQGVTTAIVPINSPVLLDDEITYPFDGRPLWVQQTNHVFKQGVAYGLQLLLDDSFGQGINAAANK